MSVTKPAPPHSDPDSASFDMRNHAFTDELETVRLKVDNRIFDQGKNVDSFYIVRQGLLGVYRHVYPNKKILVHKIGKDESAGLAHLMNGSAYPALLVPIKESVAFKGDQSDVDAFCECCPADVSRLLASESKLHDDMVQVIDRIIGKDLDSRIATELLDLASRIGRETDNGIRIIVKLSRKKISEMVGCAPESVIRVMSEWEQKNLIETEHKYITLKRPYSLRTV